MLAGLVRSPSRLAPSHNPDGAAAPRADRARRDGGDEVRQRRNRQDRDDAAGAGGEGRRRGLGAIRRRLGDGRAQRPDRPRRPGHRGRNHDRSGAAGIGREGAARRTGQERRQGRRRPGRDRIDDAGRRGARAGRRPELRREPVQPRGRRQASAGLGVQAVRLSHRDRARPHAGHGARGQGDLDQGLEAGELQPRILRAGHAQAGAGDVAQHRVGAADAGVRADRGDPHRAPARHRLQARAERLDRARHLGGVAARTGLRHWRRSPTAGWRPRRTSSSACERPAARRFTPASSRASAASSSRATWR